MSQDFTNPIPQASQTSLRIGLLGYGKMGKAIHHLAAQKGFDVAWRSPEQARPFSAFEFPADFPDIDVAIEFSAPSAATGHISACLHRGIPIVVGTTGWYEDYDRMAALCHSTGGAMLCATNFSAGVHIFWELAERMTQWMKGWPDYNIGIEEIHHPEKKDAPSGTALTLMQRVMAQSKADEGLGAALGSIPIVSHRIEGVVGTHKLVFRSNRDAISLQHEAYDRNAFAEGALTAAHWLVGKKGVFEFGDVLKGI